MISVFSKYLYVFLAFFSVFIFLAHYLIAGQAVYGDGIGYYSYLHSLVINGDFDTEDERRHIYAPYNNNQLMPEKSPEAYLSDKNYFGTGTAIMLLPFFITANSLSISLSLLGFSVPTHGYSDIYQIATGIGAVFYTILGLYILEKMVVYFTKNQLAARIGVFGSYISTNLLYYGSFDVINSHFASFFLAAFIFYIFLVKKDSRNKIILLGLLTGFITSIRVQDSLFGLVFLADRFVKARKGGNFRIFLHTSSLFILYALVGSLPALVHWTYLFGVPLNLIYLESFSENIGIRGIDLFGSLFYPTTGLFSTSSILFVCFLYFIIQLLRNRVKYPTKIIFLFFLMQYFIITLQGGWFAAAFGGRMYISSLPFFALLLAEVIKLLINIVGVKLTLTVISIFIFLNIFNITNFLLFRKQTEEQRFGTEERTQQRMLDFRNRFSF